MKLENRRRPPCSIGQFRATSQLIAKPSYRFDVLCENFLVHVYRVVTQNEGERETVIKTAEKTTRVRGRVSEKRKKERKKNTG